jgi:hypothetical protein
VPPNPNQRVEPVVCVLHKIAAMFRAFAQLRRQADLVFNDKDAFVHLPTRNSSFSSAPKTHPTASPEQQPVSEVERRLNYVEGGSPSNIPEASAPQSGLFRPFHHAETEPPFPESVCPTRPLQAQPPWLLGYRT